MVKIPIRNTYKVTFWSRGSEQNLKNVCISGEMFHCMYTEVSSFQGVGVPLYTEVSSFQGVGVPLYTEVSSFQGVGVEEFHCIQRCPHFRERCHHFRGLE